MFKKIQTKILIGVLVVTSIASGYQIVKNYKSKQENSNVLRIGVITDAHFYAKKSKKKTLKKSGESTTAEKWVLNWRSREALERFVRKMNKEFKPDIVVDIGDFVDGKDRRAYDTWVSAEKIFKKIKAPAYHVLGNHETNGFLKNTWLELTGYDKTYYYQDVKKGDKTYRMIMLDGNYLPDNSDASPDKHHYPGYIDEVQWQWLRSTLEEANKERMDILVFVHQPPVEMDFWEDFGIFPQGKKLQALFDQNNVRAVFSGHIEQMCNTISGKTRYFVLQGMWKKKEHLKREYRFKDAGNFYYVVVTPDDIVVETEHRVFDESVKKGTHLDKIKEWKRFKITEEEYNCQDGQQLLKKEENDGILMASNDLKIIPTSFLQSAVHEVSGITFFKGFRYLISDNGTIVKMKDEDVVLRRDNIVSDAEGITHDDKYLYVLSELENTIYKLDEKLTIIKKQVLDINGGEDVNIGLEGIAYYKDSLFFVTHQGKDVVDNLFLVDFKDGSIVNSSKIEYSDLAGATYYKDTLYVVSGRELRLLSINPKTLEVLAEKELTDKTIEGLDIKDNVFYLVKDDGVYLRD